MQAVDASEAEAAEGGSAASGGGGGGSRQVQARALRGGRMSVRVYVYGDTDEKAEKLSALLKISKAQVFEIAINDYCRRVFRE